MTTPLAERLLEVCRPLAGDDLLAVTTYAEGDVDHAFVADDVEERSPGTAMESLHRPFQNVHRSLASVCRLNQSGGGHEGSVHVYEEVAYLHFPAGERSGVVVSLVRDDESYAEVYAECLAHT